nr:hypothetical protein [Pyrinomonadaceae bacterium]
SYWSLLKVIYAAHRQNIHSSQMKRLRIRLKKQISEAVVLSVKEKYSRLFFITERDRRYRVNLNF